MPARDIYHDTVRNALIKDGWVITHDPLALAWGTARMYVDLGAEKLIAAQKSDRKIALEVESFVGPSRVEDLEKALGQYTLYFDVLAEAEPDRMLYPAVSDVAFEEVFEESVGRSTIARGRVQVMVFDPRAEAIVKWIP